MGVGGATARSVSPSSPILLTKPSPFPDTSQAPFLDFFFFFLVLVSQNSALWGAKLPRGATLDLC